MEVTVSLLATPAGFPSGVLFCIMIAGLFTMTSSPTKVLVTGANGFIAMHVILHLLKNGYKVRGTVRSAKQETHVREVLQKHVDTSNLEFALANLLKDEGWDEIISGCDYVFHIAAPFPLKEPKNEDEIILPARDGTRRVLQAAHAQGVKRVVYLSSIAAMYGGHTGENKTFDESMWADIPNTDNTYIKSKAIAEHAAWDFINSPENTNRMELVTLNPPFVFGPVLDDHYFTSSEWIGVVVRRDYPGVAKFHIDFTDVRDLADIFLQAMTSPRAAGQRFCCSGSSTNLAEVARILKAHFAPKGRKINTFNLPEVTIRLLALFDQRVKSIAMYLGWEYKISNKKIKDTLGWNPRPMEQTIIDMAESMIEHGLA